MFEFYNSSLRAKGGPVPFGNRYPALKNEITTGRFVTTIHAINSGIIKLSAITPVITVFRGATGLRLPDQLEGDLLPRFSLSIALTCLCVVLVVADKFGSKLGIEFGFMSTTTNKAIAVHYGKDTMSGNGLSFVFEFTLDSLNRGALIQWLSQYPGAIIILSITCSAHHVPPP